jgi:hypothetical protein
LISLLLEVKGSAKIIEDKTNTFLFDFTTFKTEPVAQVEESK